MRTFLLSLPPSLRDIHPGRNANLVSSAFQSTSRNLQELLEIKNMIYIYFIPTDGIPELFKGSTLKTTSLTEPEDEDGDPP